MEKCKNSRSKHFCVTIELGLVYFLHEIVLKNDCEEIIMSWVFNVPQSEEQFSPVSVEGESSPNQEADQEQVDSSVTQAQTNHGIYQAYLYIVW